MTTITERTEALARQLWKLHAEALGYIVAANKLEWTDLSPREREAWIQVAQFVDAQYRNEKHQAMMETPDHK